MNGHAFDGDTRPDERGWFTAECLCGWKRGPLPDLETMIDALMEHALERGRTATPQGQELD